MFVPCGGPKNLPPTFTRATLRLQFSEASAEGNAFQSLRVVVLSVLACKTMKLCCSWSVLNLSKKIFSSRPDESNELIFYYTERNN